MIAHVPSLACVLVLAAIVPSRVPGPSAMPGDAQPIELPFQPFRAGDTIAVLDASIVRQKMQIFSSGRLVQDFEQVEDKSCRKSIEILGVDDTGPTKLRVRYGALQFLRPSARADGGSEHADRSDDPAAPPSPRIENPLEGKTFLLVHESSGFAVTDEAGRAVEPSLAALVLEQESVREGRISRAGDRLARLVSGRKLAMGHAIDVDRLTARLLAGAREGPEGNGSIRMTLAARELRDVDGVPCAVFDARLELEDRGGSEAMPAAVDLRGEVFFVAATGRYHGAELEGIVRTGAGAVSDTQAAEIVGEGPWKISERTRYGHRD